MSRYPTLFSPLTIGHLRIRNRLLGTSHVPGIETSTYPPSGGRSFTHFRPLSMGVTRFSRFHTR